MKFKWPVQTRKKPTMNSQVYPPKKRAPHVQTALF
jgi:hypothetical protein